MQESKIIDDKILMYLHRYREKLPAFKQRDSIERIIATHRVVMIVGPTGYADICFPHFICILAAENPLKYLKLF